MNEVLTVATGVVCLFGVTALFGTFVYAIIKDVRDDD